MYALFHVISLIFYLTSFFAQATLEHQWVNWDGEPSVEEIPVLHTAFVQTGSELHYFSETIRLEKEISAHREQNKPSANKKYHVRNVVGDDVLPLSFDPPYLEFPDHAVGVPSKFRVSIRNRLSKEIHLESILATSTSFHVSFFEVMELSAAESTFFDVAFLPREEGKVSVKLHILTSVGVFVYEVSGRASSNPYRIPPFVGHRLAFNATVYKDISLHNPYPNTLRMKNIISSGGNVHVEMAYDIDAKLAGEAVQYWDIRPFQTKKIGRAVIVGQIQENTTYHVRISGSLLDDNGSETIDKSMIFSFPIDCSKHPGVYTTTDILDFGLLRQGERSDHQTFSVYQYLVRGKLEFETLYVDKGDATGIYMEFSTSPPIAVYPGKSMNLPGKPVDLVKVFFDASRIHFESKEPSIKHFNGRLIAVSRGGNYNVTIPFRASVYQGDMKGVGNDLSMHEDIKPSHRRSVRIRNGLPFGVAINNVSMSADARQYFSVRLFEKIAVLSPGEEKAVFLLKYNKKTPDGFGSATFYIHTNVSTYRIQFHKFTGKTQVDLFSVDQDMFDFGLMERNESRTIRFSIRNSNSAILTVRRLQVTYGNRLYLVDRISKNMQFTNVDNSKREEWIQGADLDISPHHSVLLDLELRVPMDGSVLPSQLVIATEFESKIYPIVYQVSSGSLTSIPDKLCFGNTHPGRVAYKNLQIFNSFAEDMTVTRLSTLSRDSRFLFESFDRSNPPVLRSGRLTNLGRVMFMPEAPCSHDYCYLGMPLTNTDGQWFVHGLTLPANLAEVDSYLYKKQRAKYDSLVKSGKHKVNTTIVIDTDKAKNVKIETSAELIWPRLLTRNSVHFPLTALGNFTIVNLTLSNPTAMSVAVQVIPLVIYPDADAVVDFFREHLITPLTSLVEMNETLMFSLRDTELFTLKPDSPVPKLREELEASIPQSVPRFTLSLILKPHMKVRLRLGFLPSDYTLRSSLLLIRNNLTVMEPVVVYGRGARIGMEMEGITSRSSQPLLFEIRHDHLADCNNPKRLMHKLTSTLTVRRPFTVSNTGEVPFTVVNMSINGVSCENRGFRILNCYPFRLLPNETYALDIAYTPDFLTTTNDADLQLYMHMNGSAWIFPLAATVPYDMMHRCHRALPRPPFENLMYYSCVTALIFCLVCVLACAYLEGDRAIVCAIRQQYSIQRPLFDLNNLDPSKRPTVKGVSNSNWQESSHPPDLMPNANENAILTIFYTAANGILQCVHWVWKYSLQWRNKENNNKQPNKKKKKATVAVVNARQNEITIQKEREKERERQEANAKAELVARQEAAALAKSHQQQIGKKVQPVVPIISKLTAKNSISPKAVVNNKRKDEDKMIQEEKKKKEADRRMARVEQMMDEDISMRKMKENDDIVTNGHNTTNGYQHNTRKDNKKKKSKGSDSDSGTGRRHRNNSQKSTGASSSSQDAELSMTRPILPPMTSSPSSFATQTSQSYEPHNLVFATPVTVSVPPILSDGKDYYYDSSSPGSYRPSTPTPSIISGYGENSHMNDYEYHNLEAPHMMSDDELSVKSDISEAADPDWMNESVNTGNADDDFSALSAATEMMNGESSDEDDDERCYTPNNTSMDSKKRRRGRRGRRLARNSGSDSIHSGDMGSSNSDDTKPSAARGAIGSERERGKKKTTLSSDLQKERHEMIDKYRKENGLLQQDWPMPDINLTSLMGTQSETHTVPNDVWPPRNIPPSGTPPGSQWNPSTSVLSSQSQQFNPMLLGMNLGTSLSSSSTFQSNHLPVSSMFTTTLGVWASSDKKDDDSTWTNTHWPPSASDSGEEK